MDLSNLNTKDQSEAGVPMTVRLPTGEETDIKLTVIGRSSERFAAAKLEFDRKMAKLRPVRDRDIDDVTIEQRADDEFTATLVLDWDGATDGGQPLPFTLANVVRMLQVAPYIKGQILKVALDDARFLARTPTA
ncbi:hypothetical protein [Chitinolyticbacter meiyuanensis]|uniref:hypothetical protein n=1 Tax=Chitinolyticbacter meiyuanensis TaxID=682798 RepID=UPI0011E59F67|nr:hypothetical protein [Chitinolyticbacter meiyuanensis]